MITPAFPLPVASTPSNEATGGASSVSPGSEDAPPQTRLRSLVFASGHTVYGDTRSINFVSDMLDQNEREIRLLRRQLAEALEDADELSRQLGQGAA